MGRGRGGRFRREGTWVYLWLILIDVWQKTTKFYKANTLQFKKVGEKTNLWVLRKRKQGQVGSLQQNTQADLNFQFP